ncbi:phospholipase D gamma 3 [Arabidopsis thaliana]|uniref:Phospholipase D n=1 Tax=Arabidopsis thaliana TaxID=3702 RepID=A0A1P8B8B3_ARATH|nr:phospholipase D gamma 3 [Arabidopsis thaliana]ANM67843.1 phospholipase D gamma 3 [Arabidopsis thaliana]|eukprot:NP_001329644.1 phospholipase D gamma 3 [Arabidopsis thaliana]
MAYHPVYNETMSMGGGSSNEFGQWLDKQLVPFDTSSGSLRVELLHGNLDIWVKEAKHLPNMDGFHNTLVGGMFFGLGRRNHKVDGENSSKITSDPYVTVSISGAVIGRTFVISNSENPVWMQHFDVPVAHSAAKVHFVVKDSDIIGSQIIGAVEIPTEQLCSGNRIEGLFPILNSRGKPCKQGVPGTYFPLRKGGRVTLYQDAHVDDGTLPSVHLDGGIQYRHGKCWEDMADAIRRARRLIYITGWSVFHPVRLVRRNNDPTQGTLGELLKVKSQEGVRVLVLVWDDPTSRSLLGFSTKGLMNTSDEETRRFFKHSSVQVLLCPRYGGKGHSFIKKSEVETIYTHHQKTMIVDAEAAQNRRKIVAFVGGLDLCNGRFDTPKHPLFRTLKTIHKDDFHNPNFVTTADDGPREPWHDLHSKIDGPAAYDVLANFEERWMKASKPRGIGRLRTSSDDSLLRLDRIPDIMGLSEASSANDNDPESWHVQVFRSIDSSSVKGFPKDPKEATGRNLLCGKNILIDMSIHAAYVKAIRSAQHFIYIENQYFLGSSFNWDSNKNLGANNLIPMEIALKIANKIRAREKFAAYIVIPMWPEGAPTSNPIQRILYWQHKTMQMMYQTIYKALVEVGLDGQLEPQDFLNFFCLGTREVGTREVPDGTVSVYNSPRKPPQLNAAQVQALKSRRFMIYVHSKGMVVDDEFVLIGSANINQRSLEGTRDTEIAMGGYQPHHSWAKKGSRPRGQIFGYRMSLWAEHLGFLEQEFEEPENMECVRRVRQLSELNWRQYAAEEVTEMPGHLLKYPVQVDRTGKVSSLPGYETFPDLGGKIIGSFLVVEENLTI